MFKEKIKNMTNKLLFFINKRKVLITCILVLSFGYCYRTYAVKKQIDPKKIIDRETKENKSNTILINSNLYGKSKEEKKKFLLNNFSMDNVIIANKNAPITIIDFSSYTCSFCKKMRKEINKIIQEFTVEKKLVNYVLRPVYGVKTIPFGSFLLCSKEEQRKEIAEAFFDIEINDNMEKTLIEIGKKYNMDEEYVKQCIFDEENYKKIIYMQNENRSVFDLTKTPMLLINGKEYVGYKNYEEIKNIINNILKHVN